MESTLHNEIVRKYQEQANLKSENEQLKVELQKYKLRVDNIVKCYTSSQDPTHAVLTLEIARLNGLLAGAGAQQQPAGAAPSHTELEKLTAEKAEWMNKYHNAADCIKNLTLLREKDKETMQSLKRQSDDAKLLFNNTLIEYSERYDALFDRYNELQTMYDERTTTTESALADCSELNATIKSHLGTIEVLNDRIERLESELEKGKAIQPAMLQLSAVTAERDRLKRTIDFMADIGIDCRLDNNHPIDDNDIAIIISFLNGYCRSLKADVADYIKDRKSTKLDWITRMALDMLFDNDEGKEALLLHIAQH